jgi:hypothetical protein
MSHMRSLSSIVRALLLPHMAIGAVTAVEGHELLRIALHKWHICLNMCGEITLTRLRHAEPPDAGVAAALRSSQQA